MTESILQNLSYAILVALFGLVYQLVLKPLFERLNHYLNRSSGYLGRIHRYAVSAISKIIVRGNLALLNYEYEYRIGKDNEGMVFLRPSKIMFLRESTFNRFLGSVERVINEKGKVMNTSVLGQIIKRDNTTKYLKWDEFIKMGRNKVERTTTYYHLSDCREVKCDFIGVATAYNGNEFDVNISILSFGKCYEYSNDLLVQNPMLEMYLNDFDIPIEQFRALKRITYIE